MITWLRNRVVAVLISCGSIALIFVRFCFSSLYYHHHWDHCFIYATIREYWKFPVQSLPFSANATLINLVDRTDAEAENEGLLILKYIDEYGDAKNGSVCANNFDWWKANLFCRYLGYRTGKWGSYFGNFKHVSKLVFVLILLRFLIGPYENTCHTFFFFTSTTGLQPLLFD